MPWLFNQLTVVVISVEYGGKITILEFQLYRILFVKSWAM